MSSPPSLGESQPEELQHRLKELEIQVEERTAKLRQINEQLRREISERKRIETELQEIKEQLRVQYNEIPVPTYTWQRVVDDFVLIDFNNAAKVITEGNIVKFIGKTAREMYHDRPEIQEDISRCFIQKSTIKREMRYRFVLKGQHKDLAVSFVFVPPDLIMVHMDDITARKRMEEALQESETQYSTLVEHAKDGVIIAQDMVCKFANRAMAKLTGYTVEELAGKPFLDLVAPNLRDLIAQKYNLRMAGEKIPARHETKIQCKDGTIIDVELSASMILYQGNPAAMGIIRDITKRKRDEAKLRASEERYRSLFELAPDGIMTANLKGVVTSCNPAVMKLTGFSMDELVGKHFTKLGTLRRRDLPNYLKLLNSLVRGKKLPPIEFVFKRKDGTTGWAEGHVRLLKVGGKNVGMQAILRDITKHKRVEDALRASEEKFKAQYKGIPVPTYTWKWVDGDFILVDYNDAAETITEGEVVKSVGKTASEMFHNRPDIREDLALCFTEQTNIKREMSYLFVSEKRRELAVSYVNVPPDLIMVHTENITESKRAEERLRESEARYRLLFEDSPISLKEEDFSAIKRYLDKLQANGVKDFHTYFEQHPEDVVACAEMVKVLDVNKSTVELYQAGSKEALQGGLSRIFGKEAYAVFKEELIALTEGKTVFESENINQTLTGEKLHIILRWSVAPGYEDTWAKVLVSIIDITTRKEAENARRELEERRANFIEITSHELRTPLTAIRGYAELLNQYMDEFDQERRAHYFDVIHRNVQRLERLIAGVSTLGQLERGVFRLDIKEMDFCEFLTEALLPYQTRLGDALEYQSCPYGRNVRIEGDVDRLLQVVDNLMENAVKQTSKEHRKILVIPEILLNEVRLQIVDNGAGIAPEDLDRIFEPFTTIPTEYSIGGTGIGLYLARMLVEAHGGTLTAHSEGKGRGTIFIMKLPRKGK